MKPGARRRLLVGAAIGVAVAAALGAGFLAGYFAGFQARFVDFLFASRPARPARACTLVAIDQRSNRALLPRYGTMSTWPRALYAQALERLGELGPRVIVLDVFFDAARPDDVELTAVMRRLGNVLTPAEAQGPQRARPAPGVAQEFDVFVRPTPAVRAAAAGEGFVNITTDADTVVRATPLLLRADGEELPAAVLAAVARFVRRPSVIDTPPSEDEVYAAGRAIPVSPAGNMRINFLGPPAGVSGSTVFPLVSFVDVLEGRVDPVVVRDRIVILGQTIRGADEHSTPTSAHTRMWGAEVLASAVETILTDRYLVDASLGTQLALLGLAGVLAGLLAAAWRPWRALAGTLALLALYFVAAILAFERGLVMSVSPMLALALAFAAVLGYRVVFEQAEQRRVRDVIGRYLSPGVSRWVLDDPARLALGGETREMTVLFSDVRGFTAISKALPPAQLVTLMNELMTLLADVVFQRDGTVDKFIGDALMAFWNAPQAQTDHAARACVAALDMVSALERARPEWERRGLPPIEMGIGINTGPMVVGNMGSRDRLAYTVMGDAVNVASRLEGLCKVYGVRVVVGEATRVAAGDALACRHLDRVRVKGRDEPLDVYEVLGRREDVDGVQVAWLQAWERAVALYRARQWAEAAAAFAELCAKTPADGPSRVYLERARTLAARPPGADWDGVFDAETK
ncbi:MAG TPA: adenylate/guanylate cyclase domain-containing protein [Methylomirabilota bacterium]